MSQKAIKCFRCVDEKNLMVKNGKTRSGKQHYSRCRGFVIRDSKIDEITEVEVEAVQNIEYFPNVRKFET